MSVRKQINIVESFLYNEYGVQVDYDRDYKDVYFHDASIVEINTRQNLKSRLSSLLHEAGHVIIRNKDNFWPERFPDMLVDKYHLRRNINHRIDILREEVLAWDEGENLIEMLSLDVDRKAWKRHRANAIKSYIKWVVS